MCDARILYKTNIVGRTVNKQLEGHRTSMKHSDFCLCILITKTRGAMNYPAHLNTTKDKIYI